MAKRSSRLARTALGWALAAALSGCSQSSGPVATLLDALLGPPKDAAKGAPQAPAASARPRGSSEAGPETAGAPDGGAAATPPGGDVLPAQTARRFAGGRPLPWWSERLVRLRRDGPPELYRLTVERARLNGLEVVEKEGGEVLVALARPEVRP